jgi:glycosyltransferase involved in cell wall biosynthesis
VRVLIDYRAALRGRSGVGEYGHQLVAALAHRFPASSTERSLELTIFSSSWKDRLRAPSDLGPVEAIDRRVPVSLLNFAWHRLGWPPVERMTGLEFDVTHSLHPLIMPARNAAHVVTIHDLNFLAHPERTRAEIRRDYPALARAHAHRADAVIVSSRFAAGEVERLLELPGDRIFVCPPGAPDWTARAAAPADGYVLFFGTLEPRKNVGALLDAYELLLSRGAVPDLVLAGQATPEAAAWLDRISKAPLNGHVRHLGYVDPARRRTIYEGARVLVQPSFEEGFGLPVLEAMTAGVPVVAASRGALPEVLGDAGLLVEPEPDAIAAGLARMLSDDGMRRICEERGAARSHQFRWRETAERVYDVYRQAMIRHANRH